MLRPDRFIASCASWSEFWEGTKRLSSTSEKGAVFERLTQLYLQTVPEYQSELEHIWTLREVPPHVRKLLALPTLDEGIDFIARTRHGEYWAIQSKFRSQHDKPLTRKELGTFTSLAFNTCNNIALAVVAHIASKPVSKRHLTDWTREFLAHGIKPDWICVCSDETVGNLERDEFVGEVYDLGLPTHTDTNEIAALLRARSSGPKIVFTTYQSSGKLAVAARKARITFDLAILDEAHKTVGLHSKTFATLLSDKKIQIQRRVFMTATERVFRGDRSDVLSMDNEKDYGARFFQLSFKEAIKQKIITDYKILTMTVSDGHIRQLINQNRILNLNSRDLDEAEAQSIAAGIALKRIYKRHSVNHAISFHRSIRGADRFREQQDALNRMGSLGPRTTNLHISSKKTAGQRSDLLREFVLHKRALMTNARCLTEGVDVPAIDCVMFADPKQSRVDIVQAAGRALRRSQGKECGYIVVPLVVPETVDFETFAKTTAFRQVAQTLTALSTQDERIADEFRAIESERVSSGKIVEIEGDIPAGMKMKLGDFAEAISTRIWESVGRANWRNFPDARAIVRGLGLKSVPEWVDYCKAGKKPADIPNAPYSIYARAGWTGWGDWLGSGAIATRLRQYRPFKKARAFVRGLNLKSLSEWRDYCASGKKPTDIPANPNQTYADAGWTGMGDWLGTGTLATYARQYRPFKEARAFVCSLGLKEVAEWRAYCKSGKKPSDIPANPDNVYANDGWTNMGDWLGTGRVYRRGWRPFKKARAFVRGLKLKSSTEWRDHIKSGKMPADIPSAPCTMYAEAGWAGWGDWLGTRTVASYLREYRPFKKARAYIHRLGLKSLSEWRDYCASGRKPNDIPSAPDRIYANDGWAGLSDWLGTGRRRPGAGWRPFKKARTYVLTLGLKSTIDWVDYCKSGKKPNDIPASPDYVYAEEGWSSWGDWVGTGKRRGGWQPFKKARAFVRGLGLKSLAEWLAYSKSGKKPADIPAVPSKVYANAGWAGISDWLGDVRSERRSEARPKKGMSEAPAPADASP